MQENFLQCGVTLKHPGLAQTVCVCIVSLPLSGRVTLGKGLLLPGPRFPHLVTMPTLSPLHSYAAAPAACSLFLTGSRLVPASVSSFVGPPVCSTSDCSPSSVPFLLFEGHFLREPSGHVLLIIIPVLGICHSEIILSVYLFRVCLPYENVSHSRSGPWSAGFTDKSPAPNTCSVSTGQRSG